MLTLVPHLSRPQHRPRQRPATSSHKLKYQLFGGRSPCASWAPPRSGVCAGMCHWLSPHRTPLPREGCPGHCDTLARTTVLVEYALVLVTRKQGDRGPCSALIWSMLPTSLREVSPCDVAESVFGRPQNTSRLRKPCGFRVACLWAQSACASDIIFRCLFVIVLRLECAFHISGSRVNVVSQCAHMEHAPNDVGPCDVAESFIGRPQNTSSWTGSEAECRDAVCVGVLCNSTVIRVHSLESVS